VKRELAPFIQPTRRRAEYEEDKIKELDTSKLPGHFPIDGWSELFKRGWRCPQHDGKFVWIRPGLKGRRLTGHALRQDPTYLEGTDYFLDETEAYIFAEERLYGKVKATKEEQIAVRKEWERRGRDGYDAEDTMAQSAKAKARAVKAKAKAAKAEKIAKDVTTYNTCLNITFYPPSSSTTTSSSAAVAGTIAPSYMTQPLLTRLRAKYPPGTRVRGNYQRAGYWYRGEVTEVKEDGVGVNIHVKYDDGGRSKLYVLCHTLVLPPFLVCERRLCLSIDLLLPICIL
jgi:hypothetical protein